MRVVNPVAVVALLNVAVLISATVPAAELFTPAQKKHWSFQAVQRPDVPSVQHTSLVKTPVDAFILRKLEDKKIEPSAAADKVTLLRRVTFDLIGLPPTPDELQAFLADTSQNAFEKVVDRLLSSPRYGERWGRHWLDLARYAESEGFKADETRPNAWRYRDYVIQSFNENKPYDRFVKEQIAGDELWPSDKNALIATAFNRHYPDESNARNLMQRRQEILDDITDATGATFLALTVGCARCHNHKYDPILQSDYYRLQSFYANTTADDQIPMLSKEDAARYRAKLQTWEDKTKDIRGEIAALLQPKKQSILKDFVDKYPPEIQAVIAKPAAERNPYEWQMFYKAKPYLEIDDETAAKALKGDEKLRYSVLKGELKKFSTLYPGDFPTGIGMHDVSAVAPETHILKGGVYDNPGELVTPGFLTLLAPGSADVRPPAGLPSTGRRTALANWLTNAANPLTGRVIVNRIWHWHFGQGIVATPSDFGIMGQRPSHPELLDWLADDFVQHGWDIKRLHKMIVLSSTYQESSDHSDLSAKVDSRNRLLWKFPRQRLEAEVIRDSSLAVSGMLNAKAAGPSVMPELPEGMAAPRGGWTVSSPEERNRRSVYIFVRRNARYPMLEAFDMPDTHESCGRRNTTVTAPQALSLLNNRVALDWARSFANRVLQEGGPQVRGQVDRAFELAYSRRPDPSERDTVLTFFDKQEKIVSRRIREGQKVALPLSGVDATDPAHAAAMVDFCHMLLNSNEFVYRNWVVNA